MILPLRALAPLALLGLASSPALAATHQVAIRGMAFEPAGLSVEPGDTVIFTNLDSAPHTATATDGSFDTGRLGKGQSAKITITAPGRFDYLCKVHPMMKARITAK